MINIRAFAAKTIDEVIFAKKSLDLNQSSKGIFQFVPEDRDLALLHEISFGTIRWFYQLDTLAKLLLPKPLKTNEHLVYALILVGLYQLLYLRVPEYAAISETVNAAKVLHKSWAAALINAVLRNFLRNKEKLLGKIANNLVAKYSHPIWLIKKLQKSWPNNWQEILDANNAHPPMHLRVNLQKISRDGYVKLLQEKNIAVNMQNFASLPSAITLMNPIDVNELPKFNEGFVSIQDLASQLAANLLELKPDLNVLDACAAPGGKLCHILETMGVCNMPLQQIVAVEIDANRLHRIQENLDRLNLNSEKIILKNYDVIDYCRGAVIAPNNIIAPIFDRILLDAPCSATGVIRRHPDIKLLRQETDISRLAIIQLEILEAVWPLLKVGGILLYATCSILPDENNEVIKKFLEKNRDATEKKIAFEHGIAVEYGRQILPGQDGMDGFYYAKLIKHAK